MDLCSLIILQTVHCPVRSARTGQTWWIIDETWSPISLEISSKTTRKKKKKTLSPENQTPAQSVETEHKLRHLKNRFSMSGQQIWIKIWESSEKKKKKRRTVRMKKGGFPPGVQPSCRSLQSSSQPLKVHFKISRLCLIAAGLIYHCYHTHNLVSQQEVRNRFSH